MRRGYGSFALLSLATLLLILQSCGGGGGGGGPTAPPPPLPTADIVAVGTLDYLCQASLCNYSLEHRNNGPGCANTVTGIIRLYNDKDGVIASQSWELNPTKVVRAGESFVVEGCCFHINDAGDRSEYYRAEAFWTNVRCP